eukprot:SAG11_NODE_493_length_8965_cov_4.112339_3_plen_59_part_00
MLDLCTPKNAAGYYYQFGKDIQMPSSNNPKILNAIQSYTELGWLYGVCVTKFSTGSPK